jgi:acetoin utilization deacetylase AcuC-like enzyme
VVAGYEEERGEGEGYGYNINLPMPHGSDEEYFFSKVEEALTALRLYQPDVIVLALGFDIYKDDPQAKVSVSSEGFCRLGNHIRQLGLPTVTVQEGGYDLDTLSHNVQQFFKGLTG